MGTTWAKWKTSAQEARTVSMPAVTPTSQFLINAGAAWIQCLASRPNPQSPGFVLLGSGGSIEAKTALGSKDRAREDAVVLGGVLRRPDSETTWGGTAPHSVTGREHAQVKLDGRRSVFPK